MTQPDSTSPVAAPPAQFNFAQHLLSLNSHQPDKIAFIDDQTSLSYGELTNRVQRFAAGITRLGLRREERMLLLMHDVCDWPVSFLGAMYAGVVPVAVNTLLTIDDYAYMIENSRAQAVVVSAALLTVLQAAMAKASHEVRQIIVSRPQAPLEAGQRDFEEFLASQEPQLVPAGTGPDDPGFWLYSSGSTGRPKGTVHSQANPYWTSELFGKRVLGLRGDDVCFSAAKLYFAYGLGNALTFPMSAGATSLLMAERPTPDSVSTRLAGRSGLPKPSVFFFAPTGFAALMASPAIPARDDVALRLVASASEALPADLAERFKAHFGIDIVDGIGSTEMLHVYLSNRPERVRYGSTGWPVPGYQVELRADDGQPVPDGEPGDLYIHGPSAAMMYWGNCSKSRETFQGAWTKSGDKYQRNADGSYTYCGRSDDMLKVSGLYVSPFEVEATLMQHPAVLEAAVIGSTDAEGLVKTKAFVVLKSGGATSADELKAFVKNKLAPYKYPRYVEFVDDLPKTATGKIQRFKLRELERSAAA